MPIQPLDDNQFIIWLEGKEIVSKSGEKLRIIEGKAVINGKDMDISCFKNTSQKGTEYLKGRFKEPWAPEEKSKSSEPF